jgi:Uma2 family endonuclease
MEETKALKSPTETAVGKTRSYTEYTESTILERRKRRLLPISFEKRAAMNIREVRVNASFEEYLNLAYDCEYRLHYSDGQVISFIEIDQKTNTIMGEATVSHERLVMRFGFYLTQLLGVESPYQVLGSNVKIFIAEDHKAYNPDVAVVKGEVVEKKYKYNKRTSSGIANPYIIVEVLSDSTRRFDLSDKLRDYQLIPSLQQVIFVEQGTVWASTYIRKNANEWRNITFDATDAQIPVGDGFISLEKIYAKPF